MSSLRFCMVTTFYPPFNFGGDGIGVQRLSHALARRGHQVTVIHDADAFRLLHQGPEPAAIPEPEGVEVVTLRGKPGLLSPLLTQQFGRPVVQGRRINRVLGRGHDVTMFHNVSLVGGPGILAAGSGVKLYEAHEHWLVCPSHVLWRHGRELCTSRECVRCTLSHHRPPQLWRYTGLLERRLSHVDAFIAKSEFSRVKHAEFGFSRPMQVIPYFLPDAARPPAVQAGPPNPRPYVLFVGRLEKIKGLDDVLPMFRGDDGPDLLIAGEGSHSGALRRSAEGAPRIRFLGRCTQEDLTVLYTHALALIVPSICYETFGIILIEAFRHATPVIARRIGPFPEIVEASGGGILFRDAEELRWAVGELYRNAELRHTLSTAAFDGFKRFWSESAVVPRYLDLVTEVHLRGRHASAMQA